MTSASDWPRTSATPYSVMYTLRGKPGQTTEARTLLPFQQLCRPNHPFQQQSCYSPRRGEGRASSSIPTGRSRSVPKRPLRPISRNLALPPECRLRGAADLRVVDDRHSAPAVDGGHGAHPPDCLPYFPAASISRFPLASVSARNLPSACSIAGYILAAV